MRQDEFETLVEEVKVLLLSRQGTDPEAVWARICELTQALESNTRKQHAGERIKMNRNTAIAYLRTYRTQVGEEGTVIFVKGGLRRECFLHGEELYFVSPETDPVESPTRNGDGYFVAPPHHDLSHSGEE